MLLLLISGRFSHRSLFLTGKTVVRVSRGGAPLEDTTKLKIGIAGGTVMVASEPVVWGAMRGWMKRLASAFEDESRGRSISADEAAVASASS